MPMQQDNTQGKKRVLTLEQKGEYGSIDHNGVDDFDEGDELGPFEVTEVRDVDCDHPRIIWELSSQVTDGNLPSITGNCSVCGKSFDLEVNWDIDNLGTSFGSPLDMSGSTYDGSIYPDGIEPMDYDHPFFVDLESLIDEYADGVTEKIRYMYGLMSFADFWVVETGMIVDSLFKEDERI